MSAAHPCRCTKSPVAPPCRCTRSPAAAPLAQERLAVVGAPRAASGAAAKGYGYAEHLPGIAANDSHPVCRPYLSLVQDPAKYSACIAVAREIGPIDSSAQAYRLMRESMIEQPDEVFVVLGLDTELKVAGYAEIAKGDLDETLTPVKACLRIAVFMHAHGCIIGHQHPAGDPTPSDGD